MCEKCDKIDQRIAHLKDMAHHTLDRQMLDGIDRLVCGLEAEKIELHPER
jgi:hypothetical protein